VTEKRELLECIARAICEAARDDPDALSYPPMQHIQGKKPYVVYVPTTDYAQPLPCWNWYTNEARAAIDAFAAYHAADI
jgi:hypothetical protein